MLVLPRARRILHYVMQIHERVITRIMDIVGLPHDHAEHMQYARAAWASNHAQGSNFT